MEKSLLFSSSKIFSNSNLIDNIRQSILEIENNFRSIEEIQQLLTESISYLDQNLTDETAEELFSLILFCFAQNVEKYLPLFNKLYETSSKNQFHLIITSSVLQYITYNHPSLSLIDYHSFVNDTLDQILQQIQSNDKNTMILFGHEISAQFKNDLILNLLLAAKLTQELISNFAPFILTRNLIDNKSKIDILFEKVSKTVFLFEIPQNVISKIVPKMDFSIEAMTKYIPLLSEETFKFILPQIEESISKSNVLNSTFSIAFLTKCEQYNISTKSIEKLTKSLSYSDLTPSIIEYLNKIESFDFDSKIRKKSSELPNLEDFSEEEFKAYFLNVNDIQSYLDIFSTVKTVNPFLSSSELWIKIVVIASESKVEITQEMMNQFRLYFQIFVKSDNFDQVFNSMIFSVVPQTSKGMTFIFNLVYDSKRKTSKKYLTPLKKKKLLSQFIENKVIPSNCFWKLYTKNLIYKEFTENPHPLLLYGYQFAEGEFEHEFDKLTVLNQTEESKKNLYDFIKHEKDDLENKYELLSYMDEGSVSIVALAFLFARFEGIIDIEGLTDETILPFLAVVFDYSNLLFSNINDRNDVLVDILDNFKPNQKFSLIKKALKSLKDNDSSLLTVSIDLILPNLYSLFDSNSFSFHICLTTIGTLIPFLLDGSYKANKMILLSAIFEFSNGEQNSENEEEIKSDISLPILFRDNAINLFNFIIKNLSEINEYEDMKRTPLNLSIFENEISSLIINTMNEFPTTQETVLFINFIECMCKNVPILHFDNKEKIEKVLQETIKEEKANEASLVFQFMLKNGLSDDLCYLTKYPLLLSYLQTDAIQILQNFLFSNFMKNESVQIGYIKKRLQKIINSSNNTNCISSDLLLSLYLNEFKDYKNAFIKAVDFMFTFDQSQSKFVLKPEIESSSFSVDEYEFSIISKLFDVAATEKSSQNNAFIVLKSIVYSFPFLLESNSLRIFNSILPALNDFSLLFNDVLDLEQEKSVKAAISSLSFLIAALSSPKILDEFIIWLFNNVKSFSESQNYSFIIILRFFMRLDNTNVVLISQMIKHNLVDVITIILSRDLPTGKFGDYYLRNILDLLDSFYNILRNLTQKEKIIINELMSIENAFQVSLDHCDVIFPDMKWYQLIGQDDSVSRFMNEFNDIKPYSFIDFERERKVNPNDDQFNEFYSNFSSQTINENDSVQLKETPTQLTAPMIRYLISKPSWIFNWMKNSKDFILHPTHIEVLNSIITELNDIKEDDEINEDDFILIQYQGERLFEELVKTVNLLNSDQTFLSLCNLLVELSNSETVLHSLLKFITQNINKNSPLMIIQRFINVLKCLSCCTNFKEIFVDDCGNNLLDIILTPEFRTKRDLLINSSELFNDSESLLPNHIIHLICFMLLFDDSDVVYSAVILASKLDKEKQDLLMPFIMNIFDKSLKTENKSIENIPLILNSFPSVAKSRIPQLMELLNQFLEICKEEENSLAFNKEELLDLIGSIFNVLTPKRSKHQMNSSFTVFENEVPVYISQKSPDFWNIFTKHRSFLMQEMYKNPLLLGTTFKFLLDYPELVDFNIRLSYFNEIKRKIIEEESIELNTTRFSILNDSFDLLNQLPLQDFLKMIQIQFNGEKEKLKRSDFYQSLAKELFHPKNYFFIFSENQKSFQINPKSSANKQHLDYFNFAGKIIARALLENEGVKIHLTTSLYKIILQRQLDLEDLKEIDYKLYLELQRKLNEKIVAKPDNQDSKKGDDDDDSMVFTLDLDDSDEEENEHEEESTIEKACVNENDSDDDDDDFITPVNSNQMYVDSKVEHRLKGSIASQVNALCEGFYMVIPHDQIKIFFPNELDLLICGMPMIDVNDLKRNVEFEFPLNLENKSVKVFFNAISKWDQDKLSQLVLFITKSGNSIISGFKKLKEVGNPIKIASGGDNDLPQSLPFINMLLLPEYNDEDTLNWKFLIAFNEANTKPVTTKKIARRFKNNFK